MPLLTEEPQNAFHAVNDSEVARNAVQKDQCPDVGNTKRHSPPCEDWSKCQLPERSSLDISQTGNAELVENDSALEMVQIPSEWAFTQIADPIVALGTTKQSEVDWWNLDLPLNIQDLLSGLSTY